MLHVMLHRGQVNGTEMPSGNGAEFRIHHHIGEIKRRDERIVVKFEGAVTCTTTCTPSCVTTCGMMCAATCIGNMHNDVYSDMLTDMHRRHAQQHAHRYA